MNVKRVVEYKNSDPGNFYTSKTRDAKFLRIQLEMKF
jgi:hypothetical protein